jgi:hypothetical protein
MRSFLMSLTSCKSLCQYHLLSEAFPHIWVEPSTSPPHTNTLPSMPLPCFFSSQPISKSHVLNAWELCYFSFVFSNRIPLCNPGWPRPWDSPALASWVLGLQAGATLPSLLLIQCQLHENEAFVHVLIFCIFLVLFGGSEVWTQDFAYAKQALYCLSHTSSPFWCGYFENGVLRTICLGCPWTLILTAVILAEA